MIRILRRLSIPLVVAGICAAAFVLATEPVPYSTACFQPDQEARQVCYQQLSTTMFVRQLGSLQYADPAALRRDKERIVADYRRALMAGMLPPDGPSPGDLGNLIDRIINAQLGLPI